jgi:hypothetical protein
MRAVKRRGAARGAPELGRGRGFNLYDAAGRPASGSALRQRIIFEPFVGTSSRQALRLVQSIDPLYAFSGLCVGALVSMTAGRRRVLETPLLIL